MKIDTKARVAIGAILDVAVHGVIWPVRLADISTRQGVSQSNLKQVFRRLVDGGFLASVRGPGGGYRLSRRLDLVSVADVIGAIGAADPGQAPRCAAVQFTEDVSVITAELWRGLDDYLYDYLRTVSMASVLADAVATGDRREREAVVVRVSQASNATRAKARSQSSL